LNTFIESEATDSGKSNSSATTFISEVLIIKAKIKNTTKKNRVNIKIKRATKPEFR
jgi:hypothetical protein